MKLERYEANFSRVFTLLMALRISLFFCILETPLRSGQSKNEGTPSARRRAEGTSLSVVPSH